MLSKAILTMKKGEKVKLVIQPQCKSSHILLLRLDCHFSILLSQVLPVLVNFQMKDTLAV